MMLSRYLKPVLAVALFVVLGAAWYWFEHRSRPEEKQTAGNALVIVTKSTNACFSDMVRGTGYIVPRREAVAGVDQFASETPGMVQVFLPEPGGAAPLAAGALALLAVALWRSRRTGR